LRACGTSNDAGEIHDQQTIEGSRFALCARRALRQLRSGSHIGRFLLLFCQAKPVAGGESATSEPFTGRAQVTPNPDFAGRDLPLT
jgi:hypothetical protein